MNSFAVVFVLCFASALGAALSPDQLSLLNQYKEACIVESGVDRAVVDNLRNGVFSENNEKLGCFSACVLKKIGVMNADGSHNEAVARSKMPADLPKEKVDELINHAKELYSSSNVCEIGNKVAKFVVDAKKASA